MWPLEVPVLDAARLNRKDSNRIFCAFRAEECGYLLKRSTPGQVLAAIRDVQIGAVPMSGKIIRKVIAHIHEQETAATAGEKLSVHEHEVLDLVVRGQKLSICEARRCQLEC